MKMKILIGNLFDVLYKIIEKEGSHIIGIRK